MERRGYIGEREERGARGVREGERGVWERRREKRRRSENGLLIYCSTWQRKVKRLGETKQIHQYEESAKTQKRGYLARHHRHVIYKKVAPRLSPQIEPKVAAQALPDPQRTRGTVRGPSPKLERASTSSSLDRSRSNAGPQRSSHSPVISQSKFSSLGTPLSSLSPPFILYPY